MAHENTEEKFAEFLQQKLALFRRYLLSTSRLKEHVTRKTMPEIGAMLSERQQCINIINKIDLSIEKLVKAAKGDTGVASKFEALVNQYRQSAMEMFRVLGPMDAELLVVAKQGSEGAKNELLKLRNVRQVNREYGARREHGSRYINIRK